MISEEQIKEFRATIEQLKTVKAKLDVEREVLKSQRDTIKQKLSALGVESIDKAREKLAELEKSILEKVEKARAIIKAINTLPSQAAVTSQVVFTGSPSETITSSSEDFKKAVAPPVEEAPTMFDSTTDLIDQL